MNSPEQRRLGIRDSRDLALEDWHGTAGFDRVEIRLVDERAGTTVTVKDQVPGAPSGATG